MSYQLVKSGGFLDLVNLRNYENYFEEGQRGRLDIDLRYAVTQSVAGELQNRLSQAGVEEARVVTASPQLKVYFRKGFPFLAVIAAIILALAILAVMILGWRLYKEIIPESLQPLVGTFGLLAVLLILAALAWRRPK